MPRKISASFIWSDPSGQGRNLFRLFRRSFDLGSRKCAATLHLFADSLYRLRVNGRVVGWGPARFLPAHPHFDSHDIAPFLKLGRNTILVEVNARGAASFQAVPSRGGFIAWGALLSARGNSLESFATPGAWQVLPSQAWDPHAESFSFAQGPIEILDRRRLPAEAFEDANPGSAADSGWMHPTLAEPQEHWGAPSPRPIRMPRGNTILPDRIVAAAPLEPGLRRHGFRANAEKPPTRQATRRIPFFTHLHSPAEQEIELGLFWGPVYLNGARIRPVISADRGNRQHASVRLRAGWNFLYGAPAVLESGWPFYLEFPEASGVSLFALPEESCPHAFFTGPVTDHAGPETGLDAHAPAALPAVPGFPEQWTAVPLDQPLPSPAREMAWDRLAEPALANARWTAPLDLPLNDHGAGAVVLDFGREYLGHIRLELDSPAGTIVDTAYDERLRADRALGFFQANPFTNTADRFFTRGGAETLETFHERGGRYLQITVRNAKGPVRLRQAAVALATGAHPRDGSFTCADPVFNWTWSAGVETLDSSMSDGWIDPWRERGLYLGDALVEANATRAFTRDDSMERWSLELWKNAQSADGQIPDVVPSFKTAPLVDYTLLWILMLRNYWAATGDTALVQRLHPAIARIFASPVWKEGPGGLWLGGEEAHVFIDWGKTRDAALGASAALNAFRIGALDAAAELAAAIRKPAEAARLKREAAAVRRAFHATLWDAARNHYAATHLDGALSPSDAPHANVLALLFDIPGPNHRTGVLECVRAAAARNLTVTNGAGHLELYFLYFTLGALYRHGETALAERVVRGHYGLMKDHGAWTLWECWSRGIGGLGSHCHGWACGPMVFFHQRILGVRPARMGQPSRMLVAPESECLDWAEGRVPHPAGTIEVQWRVLAGVLFLDITAPARVAIEIAPAGRLATLPLRASVNGHPAKAAKAAR